MIPQLNTQLVLEDPAQSPDGAGGYVRTWDELGTPWAEVLPGSGRAFDRSGLAAHSQKVKITVRGAPRGASNRPEPGQRFRAGGRIYLIDAVQETDATGRFLLCRAREEVLA